MATLNVEIVAVDRKIWSGEATFLFTRTTVGEIGILPSHIPLVAQLVDDAIVRVEREGEKDLRVAVEGGFLSVTEKCVSILAEEHQKAPALPGTPKREGKRPPRIGQDHKPPCRHQALELTLDQPS